MLLFIGASLLLFGTATSDLLRFEPQSKATLKLHTVLRATEAKDVFCPDMKSTCTENNTCCQMDDQDYACCLFPKAVCCSDGVHCCPEGMTCNVDVGTCKKSDSNGQHIELPWAHVKGKKTPVSEVNDLCPDQKSQCPAGTTCCPLSSGQYGCCPMAQAVCCEDHMHCCPSGYTCDVEHSKCNKNGVESIEWSAKIPATPVPGVREPDINSNDLCPDQKSQCPAGTTCCQLASGQYGCCPMAQAVCCEDHMHCCPSGYTCDVEHSKCNKNGVDSVEWSAKIPATPVPASISNSIVCPDSQSTCDDSATCCQLSSGAWGCCPLPKAACCSDHEHCCPNGYTCDVAHLTCTRGHVSIPWSTKVAAKSRQPDAVVSVVTDDETVSEQTCADKSKCPDDSTCCQMVNGHYACCPLPNAVCCSDKQHCCPEATTCNVQEGRCEHAGGAFTFTWYTARRPAKAFQTVP